MPGRGVALAATAAFLAAVPSASAWTKLSAGGLDNAVDPSPLVLANGKTLVAYREPKAKAVVVSVGGVTKTIASGLAGVGDPRLAQLPNGSLVLFAADQDGVVSFTSTVQPVAHGVRVLDDGFPVAGAVVHGGGKTVKTGASGTASLGPVASHTAVSVTAGAYAPASGATG